MFKMTQKTRLIFLSAACWAVLSLSATAADDAQPRRFAASAGGKLVLDLVAGADVKVQGTGGSSIVVASSASCTPPCDIDFDETRGGLKITTRFVESGGRQTSNILFDIQVPARFDIEIESSGGGLSIDGVEGTFAGQTSGGALTLNDVQGQARLKTMGGRIKLTNSELDGSLETMGGEILFENVVGDVAGKSMGGNVRYKNVQRRGGGVGGPDSLGGGLDEVRPDTVQISTMGGKISIEDAPEGADLHTMGGDITVRDARRFVRAKTMGGDVTIDSVDGWVQATTMGGDITVAVTGRGGDITLTSMGGDVTLRVPAGFGMDLDLEIAYTRNSKQSFAIEAPGGLKSTSSPEWDHRQGTPRKYIRTVGAVGGGGHNVKLRTVNGNIKIE